MEELGQYIDRMERFNVLETSPYSFGNFHKLSLYDCFMPI